MTTNHMPNDKGAVSAIAPADKPAIKIRRLSGDTLSLSAKRSELSLLTSGLDKTTTVTLKTINTAPVASSSSSNSGSTLKIANVYSLGEPSCSSTTTTVEPSTQLMLPKSLIITTKYRNVLKPLSKLPCLKTDEICSTMLQNLCLYSLFKCMASDCHFSNSSAETMLQHLRYHEMRTLVPADCKPSWLECAYCEENFVRFETLVSHVVTEHSTSIFQCPYCFYRACAAYSVLLHMKTIHPTNEQLVYVCQGKAKMLTSDLPSIFAARNTNVQPIKCSQGNCLETV